MTSSLQSVTLPGLAANHARPPSSSTRPTFGISLNDGRAIARAHRSDRSWKAVHASILPHKPRKRVATCSPNHTRPGYTQVPEREFLPCYNEHPGAAECLDIGLGVAVNDNSIARGAADPTSSFLVCFDCAHTSGSGK
jgi:hypothetical protein